MKATYRVLAYLMAAVVVLQATFIALGLFGLAHWVDDGNSLTKSAIENDAGSVGGGTALGLHFFGAMAAVLVALLLLITSFFAKIEGGVKWAALVVGDVVLQWVLGLTAFSLVALGALHALNAFVMIGLSMAAAAAATRSLQGTTGSRSPAASSAASV